MVKRSAWVVQIAVIVNDMADVNVDGAELAGSAEFRAAEPRLVELSSGCVCCTLRADLIDVRPLHTSISRNFLTKQYILLLAAEHSGA